MKNIFKTITLAAGVVGLLSYGAAHAADTTTVITLSATKWTALSTGIDVLVWATGPAAIRCDATASGVPTGGAGVPLDKGVTPLQLFVNASDSCYGKAIGATGETAQTPTQITVVPQK
jgi:hypothetical protein